MVSKIVRELESLGENEVSSETIGEAVMEQLRELDDVAYVRFASVYKQFPRGQGFRDGARRTLRGRQAGHASSEMMFCFSAPPASACERRGRGEGSAS